MKKGLLNADGCRSKLYHQVLCAFADQVWKWVQGGNTKLPMSGNTKYQMSGFLKALVPMAIVWPPHSKCLLEIENVNLIFIFSVFVKIFYN